MTSTVGQLDDFQIFESNINNAKNLVESMSNLDLLKAWHKSNELQNAIIKVFTHCITMLTEMSELISPCSLVAQPATNQNDVVKVNQDSSNVCIKQENISIEEDNRSMIIRHKDSATDSLSSLSTNVNSFYGNNSPNGDFSCNLADCVNNSNLNLQNNQMELQQEDNESLSHVVTKNKIKMTLEKKQSIKSSSPMVTDEVITTPGNSKTSAKKDVVNSVARYVTISRKLRFMMPFMRKTYKSLKVEEGMQIFDFSKPFEAPVNQLGASRIMDRIHKLSHSKLWDKSILNKLHPEATLFLYKYYSDNVRHNRRTQKLLRRQRSFMALMESGEISTDDVEKYRTILSREYTSSDEEMECGNDGGDYASGSTSDEDDQLRWLKVRSLAWQSNEATSIKERLDTVFQKRFATEKQKLQYQRMKRDTSTLSQRSMPYCAPDWLIRK